MCIGAYHFRFTSVCAGVRVLVPTCREMWGAGVQTPKNVRGEIEGWGRVPFNDFPFNGFSIVSEAAVILVGGDI